MYEAYYKLSTSPFRLTPDHTFRFAHTSYSQVFARLEQAFHRGESLVVLTGELGAGKTLMFNELFAKHIDQRVRCARLTTTQLDSEELLRAIALEYGLACEDAGKEELSRRLNDFLQHQADDGHHCVLMIDEAQEMPRDAVEQAVELSRLRTAGGRPLLQVFLAGPPDFARRLEQADVVYRLTGMDAQETGGYIEHRLRRAGWQGDPKITEPALLAIHEQTRGIPRSINLACNRLLLIGASEGKHELDAADVTKVMEDLHEEIPLVPADPIRIELPPLIMPESTPAGDQPAGPRPDPVSTTASGRPKEAEREIVRVPPRPAVPPPGTPPRAAATSASYRRGSRMRTAGYAVAGSFLFAMALFAASYQGGFDSLRSLLRDDRAETATEQAAGAIRRRAPEPALPSVPESVPNPGGVDAASEDIAKPEPPPRRSAHAGGDEPGTGGKVVEEPVRAQERSSEPVQAQRLTESGISAGQAATGTAAALDDADADSVKGAEPGQKLKKATRDSMQSKHKAEARLKKAPVQPKAEVSIPRGGNKTTATFSSDRRQGADSSTNLVKPRAKTARFERPRVERPVIGRPDIERAELARPDIERPVAERPVVERPEVERPEVERPEVERPEVERPDVERPDVDRADVERPKIERPKIERPKIERPKIERPKIERPKIERPDVERPDIERPDVERPDIERPDIERPDIERPDVERPEIERPKFERPEIERPKIERPKIERPDIERPDRDD